MANNTVSAMERQILNGYRTLILVLDFTPASAGSKVFSFQPNQRSKDTNEPRAQARYVRLGCDCLYP